MANLDQEFYVELGKLLYEARIKMHYSYDTLSEKINGIKTKSTLKRYEDGESKIDMGTLQIICDVLNLDAGECLATARLRSTLGKTIYRGDKYAEWDAMERILRENGYSLGFYEEDAILWINYPDGTLEISDDTLIGLYRDINVYVKFKLEDLKQSNIEKFKKK